MSLHTFSLEVRILRSKFPGKVARKGFQKRVPGMTPRRDSTTWPREGPKKASGKDSHKGGSVGAHSLVSESGKKVPSAGIWYQHTEAQWYFLV